jgi:hypothetical protein
MSNINEFHGQQNAMKSEQKVSNASSTDKLDVKSYENDDDEINSIHIISREEIIENTKLFIEINLEEELSKLKEEHNNKGLETVAALTKALKIEFESFCSHYPTMETNHQQFSSSSFISTDNIYSPSTTSLKRIRTENNNYDYNQLSKVFLFQKPDLLLLYQSSYVIVNALYNSCLVKVKLSIDESSLRHEYDIMHLLHRQANHLFICPYNFLYGSKGEICSMEGNNNNYNSNNDNNNNNNNRNKNSYLFYTYAIVMECNNGFNLHDYMNNNYNKIDFYHNFKTIGYHITEILKIAHENNIILMNLQPLNILRVLSNETSSIYHKYYNYCHSIDLNNMHHHHHHPSSSISYLYSTASKYLSPEIARIILISNHHHHQSVLNVFQPTTAIDIFAFGLIVFEIYNNNKSLWEELNVDISNIDDILICANSLTDHQIADQIYKCFHGNHSLHIRQWLLSALKIHPKERASIIQLDTRHYLFKMQDFTMNIVDSIYQASTTSVATTTATMMLLNTEKIINVINTNTQHIIDNSNSNTFVIINRFQELRHDIQCEFHNLNDIFNIISNKCIHGNWKYIESLDNLKLQLELQRNQNRLDVDAIHNSIHSMGNELSSRLHHSILSILDAATKDDISSSSPSSSSSISTLREDMNTRLQLLIEMVSNVKEHVSTCMKYASDIRRLTSKIAKSLNRYPCTFLIFPKSVIDNQLNNKSDATSSSSFSSSFLPFYNTLEKNIFNPLRSFLWDDSTLFFLCPISMNFVRCGPHGVGYNIRIPSASLRMIVPVLKWGILFLKAGLATQGLGRAVPDLASFLPVIDENYINNIEKVIILCSQPKLINTINNLNNFDQIFNQTLESITEEQEQHAYNFLADILMKKEKYLGNNIHEWEPKYTGLVKVISPCDGSCVWIAKESKQEFIEKGMNAIRMK